MCTVGRCDTVPVIVCAPPPTCENVSGDMCSRKYCVYLNGMYVYEYKSSLAWTCIVKRRCYVSLWCHYVCVCHCGWACAVKYHL